MAMEWNKAAIDKLVDAFGKKEGLYINKLPLHHRYSALQNLCRPFL